MRKKEELYPDYKSEIEKIKSDGISSELLYKIIRKHKNNAMYNRKLYERYSAIDGAIPITRRMPRFDSDTINNRINNDFFSEIVDFKTGYLVGKPIAYSYSKTAESEEETGGSTQTDKASKALTDFTTRNNMFGADIETVKLVGIYGYCGRLFYIDTEGNERVMITPSYETIILSTKSMSEPEYAVRYFFTQKTENGSKEYTVEFYDSENITTYKGQLTADGLIQTDIQPHMFGLCPLQGVMNNKEMLGDAEKVLSLIDDYDKVVSDNSNEIESFVHAYMVYKNLAVDPNEVAKAQQSGSINFRTTGSQDGDVYFLTKNINDSYTEHHLERLEDNIYRFSKTPNLGDESFGSASGISLKFKLHGLETKCAMTQACITDANAYMWRVLASAWNAKGIKFDPLQVVAEFTRNFPLDTLSEAQTVQALISAGIPEEVAYSQLSFVDDVDYVMQLKEQEVNDIPPLDSEDITGLYTAESDVNGKSEQ